MVVRTKGKISGHMVLHIGAVNVREHFSQTRDLIELELDHLRIVCALEPSFWEDRPEISDSRLSLWLDAKRCSGKFAGKAASLMMIPSGEQTFRLELSAPEPSTAVARPASFMADLSAPIAFAAPMQTAKAPRASLESGDGEVSLALRKVQTTPKTRRVGRLKVNDSRYDRANSAAIH